MATRKSSAARSCNVAVPRHAFPKVLDELKYRLGFGDPRSNYVSPEGRVLPGSFEPGFSLSPGEFAVEYLFSCVVSKYDDGQPSPHKEQTTWKKFHEAEEQCARTNRLLDGDLQSVMYSTRRDGVWSVLMTARRKIQTILGEFDHARALEAGGFGPGATYGLPRRKAHHVYKFGSQPESTLVNLASSIECISSIVPWKRDVFDGENLIVNLTRGNRVVTVPKNYKTDRTIAIEPSMNIYVQKGIGAMIRSRLKRAGCDLDDQTRNQRLALVGSIAGSLATIDLSMASDTVSRALVELLLPTDWLVALEQCRSPEGVLPSGAWITYEKFSSMGNGYTFELESLIFYALALALREALRIEDTRVSVYGDDIVVPAAMATELMDLLHVLGFSANKEKSFTSGPFRESCGKHYFRGHDVTPFYVRREVSHLSDLFLLHNNLVRWLRRVGDLTVPVCYHFAGAWMVKHRPIRELVGDLPEMIRGFAPSNWRKPRIPDGFGDGAFIGTFDECTPRYSSNFPRKGRGWEGFMIPVLTEVVNRRDVTTNSRLTYSLSELERRRDGTDVVLGGPEMGRRFVVRKVYVPRFDA